MRFLCLYHTLVYYAVFLEWSFPATAQILKDEVAAMEKCKNRAKMFSVLYSTALQPRQTVLSLSSCNELIQ